MTAAIPSAAASWREENRRDRMARAQIALDRDAARAALRSAERRDIAAARREQAQARAAARLQARKARAARRLARTAWLLAHTVDLLFVPVIIVPAVLAWTAMAAYGMLLYGAAGLALPAFSEGAMWAFAAATTLTRRRHPARPLWHLRTGTVVFAGVGAALNFAHGMTAAAGPHGPVTGTVYAVVSAAGVSVHQLVTAGPRRSAADRHASRAARAAARREHAARRAALRNAVIHLDEHGNARLSIRPGPVVLNRRRGRTRLDPAPGFPRLPLMPAGPSCPLPRPDPAPAARRPAATVPSTPGGHGSGHAPDTRADIGPDTRRTRRRTSRPDTGTAIARLHDRHPDMSAADIAARIGVSDRTVRRHLNRKPGRAAAMT